MNLKHFKTQRLNIDICNLSTLCSQSKINSAAAATNLSSKKYNILNAIKLWQENRTVPEPELVQQIVAACQEVIFTSLDKQNMCPIKYMHFHTQIPILREQLSNKERQLNDLTNNQQQPSPPILLENLQNAIHETKRQYEAIDRALEV